MADIPKFPDCPEGTPKSSFVHLHVHSDYSLLDGAVSISTLIRRAKEENMEALALTDHGSMFGVLNFYNICRANGINPIVGCEVYVAENDHTVLEKTKYDGKYYHLILLCENEKGYKNLCYLCSKGYLEGLHYGRPNIDFKLLEAHHEGLICLSACIQGQVPQAFLHDDDDWAEEVAKKYSALFGADHYYLEIQDHGLSAQHKANARIISLAKKLNLPLVVTNDIHYEKKEDAEAQEVLSCIGYKQTLSKPHQTMGGGKSEWYFKSEKEMRLLFPDCPEAYSNTIKIARMCNLEIKQYKTTELKDCLPRFALPEEFRKHSDYKLNQDDYVKYLVDEGVKKRYKEVTDKIKERVDYELSIIFKMGFSGYFLIVWEFIHWAKSKNIPIGPGRGSGAGSIVAYCMEITDIDPLRFNLLFERFLNPERVSMPDFDIDMDYDYRQDIIAHTKELYGEDQVGHIVTFHTLQPKAAITDIGRVLDIPLNEVNMLKKCVPEGIKVKLADAFNPPSEKVPDGGGLIKYKDDPRYKKLFECARKLEGLCRNTGIHASGMVIGLTPLVDWCPIFKDQRTGEVGVQYTMDVIEPCGLVKFDYLGLKTLSLIRYTEDIINRHKKEGEPPFSVKEASETDSDTFDMFDKGDSVAVFQFESPGMQKILQQVKPRCIEELTALNALYRPGPMDYIPQYIEGKWKPETIHYPDPCLEDILKETYGVMVYQEQVMQVSQRIAGFSLGAADMLRRAMGKKKINVLMGKKKEFIEGAIKNGFTEKKADKIFEIMIPFAGYGFNKSHAAAYTVLAYRTAYLKCHNLAEFMAANLTNEMKSKDGIPRYIEECKRLGLTVEPPDINASEVLFDGHERTINFALKGLKGMGEEVSQLIVGERKDGGEYKSFMDFLERLYMLQIDKITGVAKDSKRIAFTSKNIEVLIKSGAFDKLGQNRLTLLSNMTAAMKYVQNKCKDQSLTKNDLFTGTGQVTYEEFKFNPMEEPPLMEKLKMEEEVAGCFLSGHPLDSYKEVIRRSVTLTTNKLNIKARAAAELRKTLEQEGKSTYSLRNVGREYIILGLITDLKIITTKKGDQMAFASLTDYKGSCDLTIFPKAWEGMKDKVALNSIFAFKGRPEINMDRTSFIVNSLENIDSLPEKTPQEVHIGLMEVTNPATLPAVVSAIKSYISSKKGQCMLYLHTQGKGGRRTIQAGSSYALNAKNDTLEGIKALSGVESVWWE